MSDRPYNVLFLCTGNSARSIFGESIINRIGQGRFNGYSAGSHPRGSVNPRTITLLQRFNHPTGELRSKSWNEFAQPGSQPMDFVFTVCDNAAREVCPVWPGQPMSAQWPVPDPALAEGSETQIAAAFADAYGRLWNRINIFCNLPMRSLDKLSLQKRLDEIGQRKEITLPEQAL